MFIPLFLMCMSQKPLNWAKGLNVAINIMLINIFFVTLSR